MKKIMSFLFVLALLLTFQMNVLASDDPNLSSMYYLGIEKGGYNVMTDTPNVSNCHFYTWGRVYEKLGVSLGNRITTWYENQTKYDTPRNNAIAFWGKYGNMGHSVFIESITDSTIIYTEGGYDDGSGKRGYHKAEKTIADFKKICDDIPFWGYIYLDAEASLPTSSLQVSTGETQNISLDNAIPHGSITYTGSKPTEIGLYLSKDPSKMKKVAMDQGSSIANGNSFNMWFDLNTEARLKLTPATMYYFCFYAIQDGIEIKGETKNFTTLATPQTETLQYSFRTRIKEIEKMDSIKPEVPGWTQIGTYNRNSELGEWGVWQNEPIESNERCDVETREIILGEHEFINLGRYYSSSKNSFSPNQLDESYQYEGGYFPLDKVKLIGQAYKGGRTDCYKVENYNYFFFPIGEYGGEIKLEKEVCTQFRSRTIKTELIYQYEKIVYGEWSEWSPWQDKLVEENDVTAVQTKTIVK